MKKEAVSEEQRYLDNLIREIEELIDDLEHKRYIPDDIEGYHQERRRRHLLHAYKQAIPNPYFGKLELLDDEQQRETYCIGKIGVAKHDLQELVIDWRAPIADLYYSFNGGERRVWYKTHTGYEEVFVNRKRAVTIENKQVLSVADVLANDFIPAEDAAEEELNIQDEILSRVWREKSTDHQLREIIATIQKEQNEVIRLNIQDPVIVQGVAGSGKTSIALHRISYLLYQHRGKMNPEKVMILAPNKLFLHYMENILPDLDIKEIRQSTFVEWARQKLKGMDQIELPHELLARIIHGELKEEDIVPVLKYKGSLRFKKAVERYFSHIEENFFPDTYPHLDLPGISADQIKEVWQDIYRGYRHLPLNKRRKESIQTMKNWLQLEQDKILRQYKKDYEDTSIAWLDALPENHPSRKSLQESLKQSYEFKCKKLVNETNRQLDQWISAWKPFDTRVIYRNLFHESLLTGLDHELDPGLAAKVAATAVNRDKKVGYDDLAPLLWIEQAVNGIEESLDYLVVDEAQDLSPFQFELLKKFTRSMTVLGDKTQSIYVFTGIEDWGEIYPQVTGETATMLEITTSYRSTFEVMELADRVIRNSGLALPEVHPINRHGDRPVVEIVKNEEEFTTLLQAKILEYQQRGYQKIAVISKDLPMARRMFDELSSVPGKRDVTAQLVQSASDRLKAPIVFIPSYLVKGLEFDAVILANVNKDSFRNTPLDTKLLFVSITRAQEALHLFSHGEPSELLKGCQVKRGKSNVRHEIS